MSKLFNSSLDNCSLLSFYVLQPLVVRRAGRQQLADFGLYGSHSANVLVGSFFFLAVQLHLRSHTPELMLFFCHNDSALSNDTLTALVNNCYDELTNATNQVGKGDLAQLEFSLQIFLTFTILFPHFFFVLPLVPREHVESEN